MTGKLTLKPIVSEADPGSTVAAGTEVRVVTTAEVIKGLLPKLSVGELRARGYYLGTNVSHSVKKLTEIGLIEYQRSHVDRRSARIKLTAKGRQVAEIVEALCRKHVRTVQPVGGINIEEFATVNKLLHRLERFWTDQIIYRL